MSYTGRYRNTAHNVCNIGYKTPKEIPVVFHNGSKYDYHFIIKELAEELECFRTFLPWIHSNQRLLVFKCLRSSINYKNYFNKNLIKSFSNTYEFCNGDINHFWLMLRKSVYPYEYIDTKKHRI